MMMNHSVAVLLLGLLIVNLRAFADEPPQPLIVAHRGLLRHAPENTLANFRACLELRLGFEFDVQRTRDGHLVCIHDDTVDRTTNGVGKVSELTLSQIRALDAGSWFDPMFSNERVPTIYEVLHLIAEHQHRDVLVAVDLKSGDDQQEREVVLIAEKQKVLHRLIFIGSTISSPQVRRNILQLAPKAQVAVLANNAAEFPVAVAEPNSKWVYVRFLPSSEQIVAARRAGKQVFIAGATVAGNVPDNWKQAAEVGIDGILTDFPLELRTLMKAHKEGTWQSLFDGKTLTNWDAADLAQCFKVQDGAIVAGGGPLARLSYVGPVAKHDFKNFELKLDIKTKPGSNGGVFFHTGPQKEFLKKGYEVQVCNSCPDTRKSGSLLVVDELSTSPVKDDEWFEYHITVIGKRIVVKVNGTTTVDYTEPAEPKRPESWEQRLLSHGLIALQAHEAESTVYYRNIRVKVLKDN